MNNFQKIQIDGVEYYIVDYIQNLRAEDSFIHRNNKLAIFKGNGESRKYVGSYTGKNGDRLKDFFEYQNWGDTKGEDGKRVYPTISKNCFFSQSNLLQYLYDARIEYQTQEQIYHRDIGCFFDINLKSIQRLSNNIISFAIHDVSDFQDNKRGNRAYIRSNEEVWDVWRKLILPKISYLSILKIIPVDTRLSTKPLFYFRILLDYKFRSIVHPKLTVSTTEVVKENKEIIHRKSVARKGASKYRKKVFEYMPQCPFTKISDDRLLIASHIKPYQVCINEEREDQAIDYLNGLSLSPTYDKLFDQGYITFTNSGQLICGTQLSSYTWDKLNINPNAKNIMRIYPEDREEYLDYHRKFVFQDSVEDIV